MPCVHDCWMRNAAGEVTGEVVMAGPYQPSPVPRPKYRGRGSVKQLISGAQPGTTVAQARGHDSGRLEIVLPRTTPAIVNGIEAHYKAWDSTYGKKPNVQFHVGDADGGVTYMCSWANQDWDPDRAARGREAYALKFTLIIISIV